MTKYKVVGSYEEYFEAIIEANTEEQAIAIFRSNIGEMQPFEGNWVDYRIDDVDVDDIAEFSATDYPYADIYQSN
jgi:hypothetical protein